MAGIDEQTTEDDEGPDEAQVEQFLKEMQTYRDFAPTAPSLYPAPELRKQATDVASITPEVIELLFQMVGTMTYYNGIGLAANQVGNPLNCFIMMAPGTKQPLYIINPKILNVAGKQDSDEGCLSLPTIKGRIVRPERINLQYLNERGTLQDTWFTGVEATIVAHEMDHLKGMCLLDRLNPMDRAKNKRMIKTLRSLPKMREAISIKSTPPVVEELDNV